MKLITASIVGGVNEKNSVVNKCRIDNWTAERAIIASNALDSKLSSFSQ